MDWDFSDYRDLGFYFYLKNGAVLYNTKLVFKLFSFATHCC